MPVEKQVHIVDVPEGATVVGLGIVYVTAEGDVSSSMRVQGGTDKRNAQAFYAVMKRSLESFRLKHRLEDGDGGLAISRVDN